jgi:uncharacterized protein YigE (DUF2233 family)
MKHIRIGFLYLFSLSILIYTILYYFADSTISQSTSQPISISISNTPVPSLKPKVIESRNGLTAYFIISVNIPSDVKLIPNFSEKLLSNQVMESKSCKYLINGSFYDKNYQPLGLFTVSNKIYKEESNNPLINGFIWKTSNNQIQIDKNSISTNINWILQTGPILIYDNQAVDLDIHNDESARRVLAAITSDNKLFFIALFANDNINSGPYLGSVPDIVTAISTKENLKIARAINLDGGSASVFISPEISLTELTTVGSFFCIN